MMASYFMREQIKRVGYQSHVEQVCQQRVVQLGYQWFEAHSPQIRECMIRVPEHLRWRIPADRQMCCGHLRRSRFLGYLVEVL